MRKYKRKGPRPWRDTDKRMVIAVRLRGEGKSLRQVAGELGVSYETVRRDLARWETQRGNVVDLSQRRVTTSPQPGRHVTPGCDSPRTTADAMGLPAAPRTVRQEWEIRGVEVLNWR